jgi:hypothetical protein
LSDEHEDEFKRLLEIVSDRGLKALTVEDLNKLRVLLEAKDYGNNKKADKSKRKLLKQINSEIYNKYSPPRRFL